MREFPFSFKFLFESFRFLLDKSSPPEDGSCFPVDTLLLIDDNGMFMVEFVFWVAPNSSLRSAELFLLMVLSMLVIRALFPIVCITWEPISYEEATKRLDFDAELQPGENISSYKPTDMRINGQYIRLIFFPNDTIESFATIFSHCCCSSIL